MHYLIVDATVTGYYLTKFEDLRGITLVVKVMKISQYKPEICDISKFSRLKALKSHTCTSSGFEHFFTSTIHQ